MGSAKDLVVPEALDDEAPSLPKACPAGRSAVEPEDQSWICVPLLAVEDQCRVCAGGDSSVRSITAALCDRLMVCSCGYECYVNLAEGMSLLK